MQNNLLLQGENPAAWPTFSGTRYLQRRSERPRSPDSPGRRGGGVGTGLGKTADAPRAPTPRSPRAAPAPRQASAPRTRPNTHVAATVDKTRVREEFLQAYGGGAPVEVVARPDPIVAQIQSAQAAQAAHAAAAAQQQQQQQAAAAAAAAQPRRRPSSLEAAEPASSSQPAPPGMEITLSPRSQMNAGGVGSRHVSRQSSAAREPEPAGPPQPPPPPQPPSVSFAPIPAPSRPYPPEESSGDADALELFQTEVERMVELMERHNADAALRWAIASLGAAAARSMQLMQERVDRLEAQLREAQALGGSRGSRFETAVLQGGGGGPSIVTGSPGTPGTIGTFLPSFVVFSFSVPSPISPFSSTLYYLRCTFPFHFIPSVKLFSLFSAADLRPPPTGSPGMGGSTPALLGPAPQRPDPIPRAPPPPAPITTYTPPSEPEPPRYPDLTPQECESHFSGAEFMGPELLDRMNATGPVLHCMPAALRAEVLRGCFTVLHEPGGVLIILPWLEQLMQLVQCSPPMHVPLDLKYRAMAAVQALVDEQEGAGPGSLAREDFARLTRAKEGLEKAWNFSDPSRILATGSSAGAGTHGGGGGAHGDASMSFMRFNAGESSRRG